MGLTVSPSFGSSADPEFWELLVFDFGDSVCMERLLVPLSDSPSSQNFSSSNSENEIKSLYGTSQGSIVAMYEKKLAGVMSARVASHTLCVLLSST